MFFDWERKQVNFFQRLYFQNLILQRGSNKHVYDLMFFDWERKQVNFFQRLYFPIFDKPSKLSNRDPFLFLLASATTTSTSSSTPTSAISTASTSTKSTSETSTIGWSCVRHSDRHKSCYRKT